MNYSQRCLCVLIYSMLMLFGKPILGMKGTVKQDPKEKKELFAVFDKKPTGRFDLIKKIKALFTFNIGNTSYEPYIQGEYKSNQWVVQPSYGINEALPWRSHLALKNIPYLVKQYKIHLMPETRDIPKYMKQILELINKNKLLQESIYGVKGIVCYPEALYDKQGAPKIVIYVYKKDNAQAVLKKIYDKFKNEKGSGQIPQFNEKVTDFIFFAQGNRNDKQIKALNLYEDPEKVYYDPEKLKTKYPKLRLEEEDFHLMDPAHRVE